MQQFIPAPTAAVPVTLLELPELLGCLKPFSGTTSESLHPVKTESDIKETAISCEKDFIFLSLEN